jgi:hypothetical protein
VKATISSKISCAREMRRGSRRYCAGMIPSGSIALAFCVETRPGVTAEV